MGCGEPRPFFVFGEGGATGIEGVALAYARRLSAAPLPPPRKGRVGARPLHPRALGDLAESLPAPAGDPHFASGLIGPVQTRSQRGCTSRGRPVRSPGPAAPFGNDFYAPTTSANHQVCKERIGGDICTPVCSPGPASPFGNDFYAPTPSAYLRVCKEIVGAFLWWIGGSVLPCVSIQQ